MRIPRHRGDLRCRRAVELVTDYLDGTLPVTQRRRLERHLAVCPHCSLYLAQIRATISAVGTVTPEDLDARTRADLIELYRRTVR